mmetsp:Transcript_36657/g.85670  ORF Transcript_36657/g.85670 Transcript_36657/m.85670 type:complete len:239 (-) Transcript_36657:245-961(-)
MRSSRGTFYIVVGLIQVFVPTVRSLSFPVIPLQRSAPPLSCYERKSSRMATTPTRMYCSIPSPVVSAAFHMVGGAAGVPIIAPAISSWYKKIPLPSYTPPDRIFAPVWSVLYGCMGYSVGRLASVGALRKNIGFLWIGHMILNFAWAPVFFGMKRLRAGLWINILLVASLLGGILPAFFLADPLAGWLLVPYAAWVTFATFLNRGICELNPTTGGYNNAKLIVDLSELQRKAAERVGL